MLNWTDLKIFEVIKKFGCNEIKELVQCSIMNYKTLEMIQRIFREKKIFFPYFCIQFIFIFQIGESHASHTSFGRARMFASSGACGLGDRLSSRRQRQPSMLGLWPSLSLSQLVAFQQIGGEWIRTSTRVGGSVLFNCGISYKRTSGKYSVKLN